MRSVISLTIILFCNTQTYADHYFDLQTQAIKKGKAEFGHWGWEAENYMRWGTHSNRLIPVYTFGTKNAGDGVDLSSYMNESSAYRSEKSIKSLYDYLPEKTLNPNATYMDQTDVFKLQKSALKAGKKHIILVVFDGMDWQTTRNASIAKLKKVAYSNGRGTGLHFQDYDADGTTQFGTMVTAPYAGDAKVDVSKQTVQFSPSTSRGGYAYEVAGAFPWEKPAHPEYLLGRKNDSGIRHPYTDSASSATSMTAGIKTYNASINITHDGKQATPISHLAQQKGYKIGVVTSVPISHATPASAYSHNVKRHDYQDLTRDLLGVNSVSHPEKPLPGVDVLIGCGYGQTRNKDSGQGDNFVEGNAYLTAATLNEIDERNGGKYCVAIRKNGINGAAELQTKADEAVAKNKRLFGFYGVKGGHLPYQTADGDYQPPIGRSKSAEKYSEADLKENPNLSEMTTAALTYLESQDKPFWLMVESGDVDWANHDNNIDNSIGAVLSGDGAIKVVTDWVEKNSSWDETVMIVTADHGHFLVVEKPELLVDPSK